MYIKEQIRTVGGRLLYSHVVIFASLFRLNHTVCTDFFKLSKSLEFMLKRYYIVLQFSLTISNTSFLFPGNHNAISVMNQTQYIYFSYEVTRPEYLYLGGNIQIFS